MNNTRYVIATSMLIAVTACATNTRRYEVLVSSSPTTTIGAHARIHVAAAEGDTSSATTHAIDIVRHELVGAGFIDTSGPDTAELIVAVSTELGTPDIATTRMVEPTFRTIPGGTRTERVQTGTDKNGRPIYSTTTVQQPSREVSTGNRITCVVDSLYRKSLHLSAYTRGTPTAAQRDVWRVTVSSTDAKADLAAYVSVLAKVAARHLNRTTAGDIATTVDSTGRAVKPEKHAPPVPESADSTVRRGC